MSVRKYHVQSYLHMFNLIFYCGKEIKIISKANRWSPRVQLYVPLGKDRKWERERLKRLKKKRKGKTERK